MNDVKSSLLRSTLETIMFQKLNLAACIESDAYVSRLNSINDRLLNEDSELKLSYASFSTTIPLTSLKQRN